MNPPTSYLPPRVRYSKLRAAFIGLCGDDKDEAADFLDVLHHAVEAAIAEGDTDLTFLRVVKIG